MSILIKGMEMPTCMTCPCCEEKLYGNLCRITNEIVPFSFYRGDKCPLTELPPHGRLIDADALHIQLIDKELDQLQPWISFDDYREVLQMIDDAPTIIESEGDDGSN